MKKNTMTHPTQRLLLASGQVVLTVATYYFLVTQVSAIHVSKVDSELLYAVPVGVGFGGLLMFLSIFTYSKIPELKWVAMTTFLSFMATVMLSFYVFPIVAAEPTTWMRPTTGMTMLLIGAWFFLRTAQINPVSPAGKSTDVA